MGSEAVGPFDNPRIVHNEIHFPTTLPTTAAAASTRGKGLEFVHVDRGGGGTRIILRQTHYLGGPQRRIGAQRGLP